MHLARTGAFLRAVRSARLAPAVAPALVPAIRCKKRFISSTQIHAAASASPSPTQSADLSKVVDQRKTENDAGNTPEAQKQHTRFRQRLSSQPQNKVIRDEELSFAGANILGQQYVFDSTSNTTDSIMSLVGRRLYDTPNHPIAITRKLIESVFPEPLFQHHTAYNPVVSTYDNFDVLGFPKDHPGRSKTDTYYIDQKTVLRTHTSAHQHSAFQRLINRKYGGYTICADVYRRDSIDRSHFPVFHQMEGACTWSLWQQPGKTRLELQNLRMERIRDSILRIPDNHLEVDDEAGAFNDHTNPIQVQHDPEETVLVVSQLKKSLELLVQKVFTAAQAHLPAEKRQSLKVRWIEAYFPFTSPSFELEVLWQGEWLELLGCGVVKQDILNNAGLSDRVSWAWGIGIERLAMVLFSIPDIRLFWSQDERFLNQFKDGKITPFKPFSKYPSCYKDISFWVRPSPVASSSTGAESSSSAAAAAGGDSTKASPSTTQPAAFHENDIMEIVRDIAGTLVEDVKLVDEFVHPKSGKKSLCYRLNYRSNDRTLTNEEVDGLHVKIVEQMAHLPIELR